MEEECRWVGAASGEERVVGARAAGLAELGLAQVAAPVALDEPAAHPPDRVRGRPLLRLVCAVLPTASQR